MSVSTMVLMLAQICVNEAGWTRGDDCPALFAVLNSRVERTGREWEYSTRLYAKSTFNKNRKHRVWTSYLNPEATEPHGWPQNLDWENVYKPKWLAMLQYAQDIVDGKITAKCTPHHWGAGDGWNFESATARGWHLQNCGSTENAFWRLP